LDKKLKAAQAGGGSIDVSKSLLIIVTTLHFNPPTIFLLLSPLQP